MGKKGKIVRLWILIAQKKRPDALNAAQKTSEFCTVQSWKNPEKPLRITFFICNCGQKQKILEVFLDFFSNNTFKRAEPFCVAFGALGCFF